MLYDDKLRDFLEPFPEDSIFAPMLIFTSSSLGCELLYPTDSPECRFFDTYLGVSAFCPMGGDYGAVAAVQAYLGGNVVESKLRLFRGDGQLHESLVFLSREYNQIAKVPHERAIVEFRNMHLSKSQFVNYLDVLIWKN